MYPIASIPKLMQLNERQLEIMRQTYPGFRKLEDAARRTKEDSARYHNQIGYTPHEDQTQSAGR
jgi:hypothetical protein